MEIHHDGTVTVQLAALAALAGMIVHASWAIDPPWPGAEWPARAAFEAAGSTQPVRELMAALSQRSLLPEQGPAK